MIHVIQVYSKLNSNFQVNSLSDDELTLFGMHMKNNVAILMSFLSFSFSHISSIHSQLLPGHHDLLSPLWQVFFPNNSHTGVY